MNNDPIHLPPSVAAAVDRLRGPKFLWSKYTDDSATFRPGKGRSKEFKPSVMYHAVASIFREYNAACPEHKVKTHDLRKRAITLTVVAAGGDVQRAAEAIPVTPKTAEGHYIDRKRAYEGADLQRETAPVLLGAWAEDAPKGRS